MHRARLLAALCALAPAHVFAQEPMPPFAPAKGTTATFDLTSDVQLRMGPAGGRTTITLHTVVTVRGADTDGTRLSITWQHAHGEVVLPMMSASFDSRQAKPAAAKLPAAADPVGAAEPSARLALARKLSGSLARDLVKPWEALVGFSYEVVLDPAGRIVAMPGLADALDARRKLVRAAGNEDTVNGLLDERTLRWHTSLLVPVRSPEALAVGDAWKRSASLGIGHGVLAVADVEVRHELQKIEPDRATIACRGTPRIVSAKVTAANPDLDGSLVVSRRDGFVETGWAALDVTLRHPDIGRVFDQRVETEWQVRRTRD